MAIDIKCPHCLKPYKLKDEMVGKKVQCANQACRKPFAVEPPVNGVAPKPAAPPPKPAAPPKPVDAEALAAEALAAEERAANPMLSVIHMTCSMCEHKWDIGLEMQGKNVLCPDCKHRQKVPIPKEATKQDWRVRQGPQGAKLDKLENVTSAGDASIVSGATLIATNVVKIEYEPRPVAYYVKIAAGVLVPVILIAGFFVYRSINRREQIARVQFESILQDSAEELKTLPAYRAVLRSSAARYEAILNQPAGGKKDVSSRDKAVSDIQQGTADLKEVAKGYDRDFLFGELASAAILLGGDGDAVKDKLKLSWLPPAVSGGKANAGIRPSAAEQMGVQGQIQKIFQAMQEKGGDFEARVTVARRVARELIPVAPAELVDTFARDGFADPERYEADAQVGLECLRAGKPELARRIAERLSPAFTTTTSISPPAVSLQALLQALEIKPQMSYLQGSGPPTPERRMVEVLTRLAQGKTDEAMNMAKQAGPAAERLRALAAVADGMDDPRQVVVDAMSVANQAKQEATNVPVGMSAFRLATAAARVGADPEPFLAIITDDTLRPWAKAEVLRLKLAADKSQQPDVASLDLPTEPRNYRGGHAWAAYQLAKHNAAKTGENKLLKDYAGWAKPFGYFGQAGAAVGLLERK